MPPPHTSRCSRSSIPWPAHNVPCPALPTCTAGWRLFVVSASFKSVGPLRGCNTLPTLHPFPPSVTHPVHYFLLSVPQLPVCPARPGSPSFLFILLISFHVHAPLVLPPRLANAPPSQPGCAPPCTLGPYPHFSVAALRVLVPGPAQSAPNHSYIGPASASPLTLSPFLWPRVLKRAGQTPHACTTIARFFVLPGLVPSPNACVAAFRALHFFPAFHCQALQ